MVLAPLAALAGLLATQEPESNGGAVEGASGPLRFESPRGWEDVSPSLVVQPLGLLEPTAIAPAGRIASGTVVVGLASKAADTPNLFAPAAVDGLGVTRALIDARRPVSVGPDRLAAYRYAGLKASGFGTTTLHVVPTTAGVASVLCAAPVNAAPSFDAGCRHVLRSLRLDGTDAFPLGPDPRYARTLDRTLGALDDRLGDAHRDLREARTPGRQRGAAEAAARHLDTSIETLGDAQPGPADRVYAAGLVKALRTTRMRFEKLAEAAEAKSRRRFARAGDDVEAAERGAVRAQRRLREAGYAKPVPAHLRARTVAGLHVPAPRPTRTPTPTRTATPTSEPTRPPTTPTPTPRKTPLPTPMNTPIPTPEDG
jgi:hypothetical protein